MDDAEPDPNTRANEFMPEIDAAEYYRTVEPEDRGHTEDTTSNNDHEDDDNSSTSSNGFGSDISDIENNLGEYTIRPPGSNRTVNYNVGGDDDSDEFEYRDQPFGSMGNSAGGAERNWDGDGTRHSPIDLTQSHDDQPETGVVPFIIRDNAGQRYGGQDIHLISHNGRSTAYIIIHEEPMWIGTPADAIYFERLWKAEEIIIPGTTIPEQYSDEGEYETEDERDGWLSRASTPYDRSPYEQDDS